MGYRVSAERLNIVCAIAFQQQIDAIKFARLALNVKQIDVQASSCQ